MTTDSCMPARRRDLILKLLLLLAVIGKLWLVGEQAPAIRKMPHDDLLFARLAAHLLDGDWLGPYHQLTLAKGPGYPLFLATLGAFHLPLLPAQQVLWALAALGLVAAIRPLGWSSPRLFMLALALLFFPNTFAMARVERDNLYLTLVLLAAAGLAGAWVRLSTRTGGRAGPWLLLLGLALGGLAITREEGGWMLLPSVAAVSAAAVFGAASRMRGLVRLTFSLAPVALAYLAVTGSVRLANRQVYGVGVVSEMNDAQFGRAMGALQRIQAPPVHPRVPVSAAARLLAYEASPACASLRPVLEGEVSWGWRWLGREAVGEAWRPDEYVGGLFVWALRDAVAIAGHAADAPSARAFYGHMADELDRAAAAGSLPCRPGNWGLVPRWQAGFAGHLASAFLRGLGTCLRWPLELRQASEPVPDGVAATFARVTGQRAAKAVRSGRRGGPPSARERAASAWAAICRVGMPCLLAWGIVAATYRCRRGRAGPAEWIASVCLASAFLRLGLLAYVDVASFPAFEPRYLAPVHVLLTVAALLLTAGRCSQNGSAENM